jgi:hypothetical protein
LLVAERRPGGDVVVSSRLIHGAVIGVVAVVVAALAPAAGAVHAVYSANATGPASSASQSVPASAAPTAVVAGVDVTVSWQATTMSGGTPVGSYTVRRYDTAGDAQPVGADCDVVTTNTCIERNVPFGTWRYSVQPRQGNWSGAEGTLSAAVTVQPATFTLSSTAPITTVPADVGGTISGFTVGETLTYRLDSETGPLLSGTAGPVTTATAFPVTVTVPAGTSDAPHSIFVIGSTGTVASAAIDIVIPPNLVALEMFDRDANGKVDQVVARFDDTLGPYSAGVAPWTLTNVPSGGTLASVSVAGSAATLSITEGPGAPNTAVGAFTVELASNSAGIRDVNDRLSSFGPTAPLDRAAPAPLAVTMRDVNTNGKVDQVTMSFSEPLAAYTAGTLPWTLTNVPSGGTLASVGVASPNVTLTITEGPGGGNTAVGAFTVTLAASSTGIRDAAGNLTSFGVVPIDGARPIRLTTEMFDDNRNGKVDRVLVGFSEPLAPYSAPTTIWPLTAPPSGATLSTVVVSGAQATLNLAEGPAAPNTAVGSFRVALTSDAAGVRDAAGNLASFAAVAPTDRAAPAPTVTTLIDNNRNGRVDRLTVGFSESLAAYSAGAAPWTLANVPSGGTIGSVTASGATATIAITEGAGALDTAVGSMTVALATSAAGIRDAAGNLTSFGPRTPLDGARPVSVTITDTNGTADGRIEPGDTLVITLSEALAPASVPASTTVTMTDPLGGGNDTLSITGILNGARTLGANTYITPDNTSAAFAASPVVLSNGNRTITITVGPTCSGAACVGGIGQRTTNANFSYLGATTLTDLAGNPPVTNARTFSMRVF